MLREWAYARAYSQLDRRSPELLHWLHHYNWHRPHGSLKANTPISRLGLSEDNLLRLGTGTPLSRRRFALPSREIAHLHNEPRSSRMHIHFLIE